jgi:TRAP-type mannitol/chloroaromatic compound transport system permease small subunit
MTALLKVADVIDAFVAAAGKLAAALLLAIVALVAWNVVSRYVIGTTPVALQELEWHLLAPVALLGIAALMQKNGHVRVDMAYERMPPKVQRMLDLFSMIVGVVVAILIIKYSFGFWSSSFSLREGSPDPGGLPYRYALKALIPVGMAILGLQCFALAVRHAAALAERQD